MVDKRLVSDPVQRAKREDKSLVEVRGMARNKDMQKKKIKDRKETDPNPYCPKL